MVSISSLQYMMLLSLVLNGTRPHLSYLSDSFFSRYLRIGCQEQPGPNGTSPPQSALAVHDNPPAPF